MHLGKDVSLIMAERSTMFIIIQGAKEQPENEYPFIFFLTY